MIRWNRSLLPLSLVLALGAACGSGDPGNTGAGGGVAGRGGGGGTGGCAPNQVWCPGCEPGTGACYVGGCPGAACPPLDGGIAGASGSGGGAGTGGVSGRGGSSGLGGRGGSAGASAGRGGGSGAGGLCGSGPACMEGQQCCNGSCADLSNDPFNCGGCGTACGGATPHCSTTCIATPCSRDGSACAGGGTCCGSQCCAAGDICCTEAGPVTIDYVCHRPTASAPTCPGDCAPLCKSDRNVKRQIEPVDAANVLAKLRELPISTWTYIEEPPEVRHLGPMAQDFRASFGLGDHDDRRYNAVDAHGVALAAIQALDALVAKQQKRIEALERENRKLARRLRR